MGTMVGVGAYLDVGGYLRATTGQETASLLGLNTTLTAAASVGASSLVVAASVGWASGLAWLLDGPYSELVTVTSAADGTHVTLAAGTLFAHGAGVSVSQAGSAGALAEVILRASAWIENYCRQGTPNGDRSLFAVNRMERWGMPGTRAWLDRDAVLTVRPGHFPVQSVTALSVDLGQGQTIGFDVSQVEAPASGRIVEVPLVMSNPVSLASLSLLTSEGLSRSRRQWVVVTYTGGLTVGAVPYDVQQACVWVVSELLAQRRNPSGAAGVKLGKYEVQARPRVDPLADSILLTQAKAALEAYRVEGM
ncbi:MAG: hypothetical protein ABI068_08785 [Ktedonobacterales bacterium]